MNRPYTICHMVMSIDGKVTGNFLYRAACEVAAEHYYRIHRDFHANGFACGRVTMEGSFTQGRQPDLSAFAGTKIPREDFVADSKAAFYAVSYDSKGKLGWNAAYIADEDPGYDQAHIVEVLCESVSDAYLAYLQSIGVSYIFAGKENINVPMSLCKLKKLFGIETLLLEGGSVTNGSFQGVAVIDELSLVVAPVIANAEDKSLFWNAQISDYTLVETKSLGDGVLWLRYKK